MYDMLKIKGVHKYMPLISIVTCYMHCTFVLFTPEMGVGIDSLWIDTGKNMHTYMPPYKYETFMELLFRSLLHYPCLKCSVYFVLFTFEMCVEISLKIFR